MNKSEKAEKYYKEGKVSIAEIGKSYLVLNVQGTELYQVAFRRSVWECNCPAHVLDCAHVQASQMWLRDKFKSESDTFIERLRKPSFKS